jgi:Flp pilus assembly protein CpaB
MSVVDTSAVVAKKVPKSQVPEGALLNSVQVVGKVVTDRMVPDQPFTKFCFAREGHGVFLASAVPPGKRAMSITLNDWSGMAGLLYPGSVVDVLVSFKTLGDEGPRERNDEMRSTTLLQGLQVMAIGSQSIADDEYKDKDPGALAQRGQINTRMVTLLVNPKQAEILQLAMNSGSISLAMRNPLDSGQEARRLTRAREISPDGGMPGIASSSDDPFSEPLPKEPQPAAPAVVAVPAAPAKPRPAAEWETIIIRGKASQIRTFPLPPEADGAAAEDQTDPAASTPKVELAPEPAAAGAGA